MPPSPKHHSHSTHVCASALVVRCACSTEVSLLVGLAQRWASWKAFRWRSRTPSTRTICRRHAHRACSRVRHILHLSLSLSIVPCFFGLVC
jgi:hypothetical protein